MDIKPNRKANRLLEYDYSQLGCYFVTICIQNRLCLFGDITNGDMILNGAGKMAKKLWKELPKYYSEVEIDCFQIMPNHLHGIIHLVGDGPRAVPNFRSHSEKSEKGQPQGVVPTMSLSDVIHRFKTLTTKQYIDGVKHHHWARFDKKLWQRSFHDHIIRNDDDLYRVREYIQNNPLKWHLDRDNPENWSAIDRQADKQDEKELQTLEVKIKKQGGGIRVQISIVSLSEISNQLNVRVDAEYWHPSLVKLSNHIQKNSIRLGDLIKDGYRVVYENTKILSSNEVSSNYPKFLQAADIESPIINIEKSGYVSNDDWIRYEKGRVIKGEILLEVKGNVKKVAIIPDDFPEIVLVSGTLYKFTVNDIVNKYFLVVYLSCNIGQKLKNRLISNIATPFISKSELYEIPIPLLSRNLQDNIERVYLDLLELRKEAEKIFQQTEILLLSELGLENVGDGPCAVPIKRYPQGQPQGVVPTCNWFIKNYSDTEAAERIDAEYYQPKYEEIIKAIQSYSGGWDTLGNLVAVKKCVEVGSGEYLDKGIPFLYLLILIRR